MNPSSEAARQRQIQKDRRRKHYDDLQVQGTNNSSIVSKRLVEMIYNSTMAPGATEWFKVFVPKAKRRSPAINRGYWLRMESIKRHVLSIVHGETHPVNVINLGCGFDPLPFQLLEEGHDINFVDIDYPELVGNKLAMIKQSEDVLRVIGPSVDGHPSVLSTANYHLVGCDLKDKPLYEKTLDHFLAPNTVNIFIAEVSLAYMKPEHANPIIEMSSRTPNLHVLVLEQILPAGRDHAFAAKMLHHFSHLRSPLQCVETYPTQAHQVARFQQYFPHVEVADLFENWQLIDQDTKRKLDTVEAFDEWEEFLVFCHHYVIVHGSTTSMTLFSGTQHPELPAPLASTFAITGERSPLDLKFAAAAQLGNKTVIFGGQGQTRTSQIFVYHDNQVTLGESDGDVPCARMGHTLTAVSDTQAILVGGRARPGLVFNDCYLLTWTGVAYHWKRLADISQPRARHAARPVAPQTILIVGGGGPPILYSIADGETPLNIEGQLPDLRSASLTDGYLFGGYSNSLEPRVNRLLYQWHVDIAARTMRMAELGTHPSFGRIGAHAHVMDNRILVVGGVSPDQALGRNDTIICYDIRSGAVWPVPIPTTVWRETPPLIIGLSMVQHNDSLLVIGGGGVCYSFGSAFNHVYRITKI